MQKPNIKTTKLIIPMIYAYTTPGVSYHDGYIKIGYTEQDVDERIRQQTHTAGIKAQKEWTGMAFFDDGSGQSFKDHDFHAYLRQNDIKQPMDKGNAYFSPEDSNEWFYISPADSKSMFNDFRQNHGILEQKEATLPYILRQEQAEAVAATVAYKETHPGGEYLWNAKPRFGKTLSVYDLMKKIEARRVLIVTNRPAIANSWYSDYAKFIGREAGFLFVSTVDGIKDRPYVISYDSYKQDEASREKKKLPAMGMIDFVSLQDLKGAKAFGGQYEKLSEIGKINWDLLVIDEAHEGVDTLKTDVAFDRISRKFTLHLSGTPFKALANDKFHSDAIFNYTYADEQRQKRDWDVTCEQENPYEGLPKLNLYTYQMSEIVRDELAQGLEVDDEQVEYAFDLNEFFRVEHGRFVHNSSVDKFLDALTRQTKFPFSTEDLRVELKHTFWLLDRVESARKMADKLREHPVFQDYEIILAAGDGKIDDDEENMKSYDRVVEAIKKHEKTITLSVGQLTTGITIPEWTAVLMLSNVKSPALYMQAAFRAQNPCLFHEGKELKRKQNAYVFDFDPARTLIIFEEFANDLSPATNSGKGDMDTRKANIYELLNFFPVIGEDENGELIELDAEKVLSIPRKIKSVEVVRRGFMSNFLFQNINNVFGAPREIIDIIQQFEPVEEAKSKKNTPLADETDKDLSLNEDGDVDLTEGYVIGKATDIFGDKKYETKEGMDLVISTTQESKQPEKLENKLSDFVKENVVKDVIQTAAENYGDSMRPSDKRQIEAKLNNEVEHIIGKTVKNYEIEKNLVEQQRVEEMQNRHETGKSTEEITAEYKEKQEKVEKEFKTALNHVVDDFKQQSQEETVKTVETKIKERERDSIGDRIRNHLRGFSRTIPSFLMAYGDDTVTLATFDSNIPDKVFVEVTSITLEQFRLLRDGGIYTDSETGEEKAFKGHLFDPVVFDDSVKEFLALKQKLANYFDEKAIEDIFNYIPPQKTNQIFTPKDVVKHMVDMLEEENPGCFDDKDKTFIDLYMKSGLYITEIVKRLYKSENLKEEFPDGKERLRHIFAKQVYGLAPTEIIYEIATNYILGFADGNEDIVHNFRQLDALPYAQNGTLQEKLDELFGK